MNVSVFIQKWSEDLVEYNEELDRALEPTKLLAKLDQQGKMALFRVRGYKFKCVGNLLATRRRLYSVLGAQSDEEAYRKLLQAERNPVKPKERDFFDYYRRIEVNLNTVPFIKFYPGDGGFYLTSSVFIACLEEVCNASIHRTMFLAKDKVVARIVPRHLRYIYEHNKSKGLETPVAIVVSAPPAVVVSSASSPPFGVFELHMATAIDSDIKLVRTPIYGIPVPAEAGLVIEGRITAELADEGPFVDLLHTYDTVRQEPVIRVDGLYIALEDRPVHVILPAGNEHKLLQSFYREALIWESVSKVVPRVRKVRLTPASGSWLHAVISITKLHEGDGKNAIMAAFAAHPSLKHVVVVDEDVDPDNLYQVEWAIATRVQASRSLLVVSRARCSTLDPSSEDGICDKIGIDATIPKHQNRERFRYVDPLTF